MVTCATGRGANALVCVADGRHLPYEFNCCGCAVGGKRGQHTFDCRAANLIPQRIRRCEPGRGTAGADVNGPKRTQVRKRRCSEFRARCVDSIKVVARPGGFEPPSSDSGDK